MSLNGILDGENWVFDIQEAKLYGFDIHTAEDYNGKRGYLTNPSVYDYVGRDEEFRQAYKRRTLNNEREGKE